MARPTGAGTTTARSVRVPDERWERAQAAAAAAGEPLSEAINRFLEAYAGGDQ